MKMVEISYRAELKEFEKLTKRLERQQKTLEKALKKAEKYGVAEMTHEEHYIWIENVETEGSYIKNKEDIEKNSAWFSLYSARRDVEETEKQLEKTKSRLDKKSEVYEEYVEEVKQIEIVKGKEKFAELDFAEEQKEWEKDGIKLIGRYTGYTPKGEPFIITRNRGVTERSLHCFTLTIGRETIFTSGEFWRCYLAIKNN